MAEAGDKRSFWTTLPGILTGIAGILSGIGAVLAVVLNSGGGDKGPTLETWAKQANEICETANEDLRALGGGTNVDTDPRLRPRAVHILVRANEKIVALDRPTEGKEKIRRLVAVVTQQNVAARNSAAAAASGDRASAQAYYADAARLTADVSRLDGELGAYACAQPP